MLAAMPGNGKACFQSYSSRPGSSLPRSGVPEIEPRRIVAFGVALYASIFSFVPLPHHFAVPDSPGRGVGSLIVVL